MAERLKKGNVWMVCVGCGYREQYPEEQVVGVAQPMTCPACQVQVLNVESKTTKGWAT